MLRFLIFLAIATAVLAWDPSLKIAEKIAIPHHIRHNYEYPYINFAQQLNRPQVSAAPQAFSQPQPQGGFDPNIPLRQQPFSQGFQSPQPFEQNRGFQSPQPLGLNRGFQSQPFEQSRGPAQQTRFFRFTNRSPSFSSAPPSGGPFLSRRQS